MLSLITEGLDDRSQEYLTTAGLASRDFVFFLLRICLIEMMLAGRPVVSVGLASRPVAAIALSGRPSTTVSLAGIPDLQLNLNGKPVVSVGLGQKPSLDLILEACPV